MGCKCLGLTLILSHSLCAFANLSKTRAPAPEIRVLIGSSVKEAVISGLDLTKKIGASSKVQSFKGRKSFSFNCRPLKKHQFLKEPLFLASIDSATGLLGLDGRKYRGSLLLVAPKKPEGCDIINSLSLETYIGSVLAKEMSPDWPIEALKAQAVAARSYAYFKIKTREVSKSKGYETYYDLENSERHQVNGDFFDVTISTSKAQRMTSGEILTFTKNGKSEIAPIFFHSKCGGRTRKPEEVWSNEVEGYQSVDCPFCHSHGTKNWKKKIPIEKFYTAIDKALSSHKGEGLKKGALSFQVAPDQSSRHYLRIYDDEKARVLKKSRIRSTLGRKYTLSNTFSVKAASKDIILEGRGFGHGVGLCQFGAFEMAKRGYTYKEILKRYFPAFTLEKIY